jgi:hypothetical protein
MKKGSTVLGVVAFLVMSMTGAPEAQATCANPRVVIIDYKGWPIVGQPGYYQCGGMLWGITPDQEDTIGQKIIYCDGSVYTWGQVCEPDNGYNQIVSYGEECDCGPDQPNSARVATKAQAARAAKEAMTFRLR